MNDENIIQRSIWWKIYFVLITGLYILGIASSLISGEAETIDFIEIPISITFTIGLYGYVFSKKILQQKIWLYVIIIDVLANIYHLFLSGIDLSNGMTQEEYLYVTIFAIVFSIPSYLGLILYSLPSNKLWAETSNKNEETNTLL